MLVNSKVDFSKKVSDWDGFGFNYVETAQTIDYGEYPQDYGGFSTISEEKQQEVLNFVFGEDGLKPAIVKMFLDPFHQTEDNLNKDGYENLSQDNYDHETFTKQMLSFFDRGMKISKEQGRELEIITTLYGPPAFMTTQKVMRGRDINPKYIVECAKYMVAWAKYLKDKNYPIKYISIHNEGEDYHRWPYDGSHGNIGKGHDYNMYWTPKFVAEFMPILRGVLDENDMKDIGVTPGETSNWTRFANWGYANAISESDDAMNAIGLITSHGFSGGGVGETWYGDHRSSGIDEIREIKSDLHAWVTSTSWAKMDSVFLMQIHGNIYSAKVNAIIPWAGVQRPSQWVAGDPNPGNAIQINEDGNYEVRDGYYYYKQVCPIGQRGMEVVRTSSTHTSTGLIAFASGKTNYPNAFSVVNAAKEEATFIIEIVGTTAKTFSTYATSSTKKCEDTGVYKIKDNILTVTLEANSAMTFTEIK